MDLQRDPTECLWDCNRGDRGLGGEDVAVQREGSDPHDHAIRKAQRGVDCRRAKRLQAVVVSEERR